MALSNPVINMTLKPAFQQQLNEAQKVLFVGQMTSGSATAGTVEANIGNENEQDALFGADSMLATMVRAFKRINKISRVDALVLADGGSSTDAIGTVAFSGTAGENGTIEVIIGSKFHNIYELTIAKDDTADNIGDALVALLTADTTALVDGVNTTGSVALTSVNAGREANFISIRIIGTIAGITYTVAAMSGGAGEPDGVSDGSALNAINADTRYQAIIYPQTYETAPSPLADDYEQIRAFLTARFPVNNRVLDGQVYIGRTDSLARLKDLGTLVDDKVLAVINGNKQVSVTNEYEGAAILEMDYVIATYFAAIRALRLTDGTQIGQYIVAPGGSNDDVGGIHLATLPYMNTPFENLLPVADSELFWSDEEITELLDNGISVIGNNIQNDKVITGQMVTTYLTDAAANQDVTFKFLNYWDTSVGLREFFFNNLRATYPQTRLAEGDLTPLYNEVNEAAIRATLLGIYNNLAKLVQVERGSAAVRFFKDNLTVIIDKATGTAAITMTVAIITQLRKITNEITIAFEINL